MVQSAPLRAALLFGTEHKLLKERSRLCAMLASPVTTTPFSVKDILKLEQQHAYNQQGFSSPEPDAAPFQSLQYQCMHSALSRSLELLYSPEKPTFSPREQVKCALNVDDFGSCGSPTEEDRDHQSSNLGKP